MSPAKRRAAGRLGIASAALASVEAAAFYLYWWSKVITGDLRGPDFYAFYAAARLFLVRGGGALYSLPAQKEFQAQVTSQWGAGPFTILPYIHPPHFTLLISPLGLLPYRTAYYAWALVNLGLAALSAAVLIRSHLHGRIPATVAAACFAGFLPLFITLLQGQSDLLILAFLAGSFAAWKAKREATAGALASLAMIKPQLILLLPVLFLVRRSIRAVAGFGMTGVLLVLISAAAVGLAGLRDYLGIVLSWLVGGHEGWPITAQSMYSLRGLLEQLPLGHRFGLAVLALLAILVAVALIRGRPEPTLDFGLVIAASVALSPYLNLHDLVLLTIPAFAIAALALTGRLRRPAMGITAIVVAAAGAEVTLLVGSWSALAGVLALAGYLLGERLYIHEKPFAVGEISHHGNVHDQSTHAEHGRVVEHLPDLVGDQ